MNFVTVNIDQMKMYIIQSKTEIVINVDVVVKNQLIAIFVEIIICGILVNLILKVTKY